MISSISASSSSPISPTHRRALPWAARWVGSSRYRLRYATLVAACATSVVVPLAGASPAAGTLLEVKARLLSRSVHLVARYGLWPPAGCPLVEPAETGSEEWADYFSAFCGAYRQQRADLVVRVYHAGRLRHSEDAVGSGSPTTGGHWDGYVRSSDLLRAGRCQAGVFYWKLTLYDPYSRRGHDVSRRGSFRISC
jgi:hypothetical protein